MQATFEVRILRDRIVLRGPDGVDEIVARLVFCPCCRCPVVARS